MLPVNILLLMISPYTTIIPVMFVAYKVMQGNGLLLHKNPWNTGLILLFLWSFISGLLNKNPISATASIAFLLSFFVSIYLQNYYTDKESIERLLKYVILFAVLSAFIGIAEKVTCLVYNKVSWGRFFGMSFGIPQSSISKLNYRISATFGNPNVAGTWFSAIILICYYFYDNAVKKTKFLYMLLILLFLFILDLTGSRGAAFGLLCGIMAYTYFKNDKKNMFSLFSLFVFVVLLMFVVPQFISRTKIIDAFKIGEQNPILNNLNTSMQHDVNRSINSRWEIWLGSLSLFRNEPITGSGLLGIYFASKDLFNFYVREPHAHNILLTFASTLGIVGVCIYLYMKYYLFKGLMLLHFYKCKLTPVLAGVQAIIISHGLVDATIFGPQGAVLFISCSAIITSLAAQYGFENENVSETYWLRKRIHQF
ncbi:MAG: O-antigen ligase family protein [Clostridiales bacterium]|nr:O-antigen ligase family protein [Clostridiales bacterium]